MSQKQSAQEKLNILIYPHLPGINGGHNQDWYRTKMLISLLRRTMLCGIFLSIQNGTVSFKSGIRSLCFPLTFKVQAWPECHSSLAIECLTHGPLSLFEPLSAPLSQEVGGQIFHGSKICLIYNTNRIP